jgi:hypothetical protein
MEEPGCLQAVCGTARRLIAVLIPAFIRDSEPTDAPAAVASSPHCGGVAPPAFRWCRWRDYELVLVIGIALTRSDARDRWHKWIVSGPRQNAALYGTSRYRPHFHAERKRVESCALRREQGFPIRRPRGYRGREDHPVDS